MAGEAVIIIRFIWQSYYDDSLTDQDWKNLGETLAVTDSGKIFGRGVLNYGAGFSSPAAYHLTAVTVPGAMWLFGSALAGLGWMKRMKVSGTRL